MPRRQVIPEAPRSKSKRKRKLAVPILLQLAALIGLGALLYPTAADWFATRGHDSEVSGYVSTVEQMPDEDRQEKLEIARTYNEYMPAGTLRDPYGEDADQAEFEDDEAYRAYLDVLRISDNGVIGEFLYPRLGIGLPIYHGTSNEVVSKGVGHLFGSTLPVGGPSTHSVLTSHSGLVHAKLFSPLQKAEIGDIFQVKVLGETLYYQVDGIETVEPFVTDSLMVKEGEDRVSLVTCTPIGVNSHRLLVHGIRIPAPDGDSGYALGGDGLTAGFPWWAVAFVGGSGVIAYLLFAPPRTKKKKAKHA
ncbi:MAG: class C sortase [Scrofimicrobium sp.]